MYTMNYKLIKIVWQALAIITLLLCAIYFLFFNEIKEIITPTYVVIISLLLLIPFFTLKIIYDQKYPPSKNAKTLALVIAISGLILSFFINKLLF